MLLATRLELLLESDFLELGCRRCEFGFAHACVGGASIRSNAWSSRWIDSVFEEIVESVGTFWGTVIRGCAPLREINFAFVETNKRSPQVECLSTPFL